MLHELYDTTTHFDEEDVDNSLLQIPLLDYVKSGHPRVLFVGYGETDNWAHQGRYDLVLDSAHRTDYFIHQLWDTMQAMPQYRGTTTFIITTDHGRGSGLTEWKEHGVEEKGSENVWIAVIGPDTAPQGERANVAPVTQAQIAATAAAFVAATTGTMSPRRHQPSRTCWGRRPSSQDRPVLLQRDARLARQARICLEPRSSPSLICKLRNLRDRLTRLKTSLYSSRRLRDVNACVKDTHRSVLDHG